jgi:hypothetical protein
MQNWTVRRVLRSRLRLPSRSGGKSTSPVSAVYQGPERFLQQVSKPSQFWELERYLTESRKTVDRLPIPTFRFAAGKITGIENNKPFQSNYGVEYALLSKREVYVCAFELLPVFFLSCYLYLLLTSAASNRKRRTHPRIDLQILPIPLGAFGAKSQRF